MNDGVVLQYEKEEERRCANICSNVLKRAHCKGLR